MVFSLQSFDRIPWAVAVFMVRRHVRIAGWLLITASTDLTWLAHLVVESCTSSDVFSLWTCCGWQRSCWRICKYFQAGQSMLQLLVWLHMSGTEPGSARVHNSAQNLLLGVALWSGPGALFQLQNPEILMRASLLALTCCLPNCWHGKQNAVSGDRVLQPTKFLKPAFVKCPLLDTKLAERALGEGHLLWATVFCP